MFTEHRNRGGTPWRARCNYDESARYEAMTGLVRRTLTRTFTLNTCFRHWPSGCSSWSIPLSGCGALLLVTGCAGINPKTPDVKEVAEPQVAASSVHLPIVVSMDQIRSAAEAALPSVIDAAPYTHSEGGGVDNCGWDAGYRVERDPLIVAGSGSGISTTLNVRYQLKGRKKVPCPGGPNLSGSCGFGSEWPRRASATFNTSLGVQPDWTADVQTSPVSVEPGNACKISFLSIDVTSKVIGFFGSRLNDMTARLEERARNALSLKERVQKAWAQLQAPIDLGNNSWLAIDPQGLAIEPISATSTELRTGVRLEARPRVVVGNQPPSGSQPLPNASTASPGNSFYVLLPVHLEHRVLRDQLKQALKIDQGGTLYPPAGSRQVRIVDVDVYGYGQKAVVWLKFEGSAKGHMYLTGTPSFDAASHVLSFPDLEYDVDTRNLMLKAMDWFKHDEFRDYLRGVAHQDLTGSVTTASDLVRGALNKQYGDVKLNGTVDNLNLLGFFGKPEASQFIAYFLTSGTLGVTVP